MTKCEIIQGAVLDRVSVFRPLHINDESSTADQVFESFNANVSEYIDGRWLAWRDVSLNLCRSISALSSVDLPEMYWRALIVDNDLSRKFGPEISTANLSQLKNHRPFLKWLETRTNIHAIPGAHNITQSEIRDFYRRASDINLCVADRAEQPRTIWLKRSFFLTKGGSTRVASQHEQTGVLVCVFWGGPIMNSRCKHGREACDVVTDGYTPGLMQGEAYELLAQGGIKD